MSIKINIKATGIQLTPAISDYASKKVEILSKLIDPSDESAMCDLEVGKTTGHHKTGDVYRAEINLRVAGKQLRAVAEKENLYAAIDAMKDEISHELKSYKTKKFTLLKKGGQRIKQILRGLKW